MAKRKLKMDILNPNAAGIDIGSRSHLVAINQEHSDVREFGVYAQDTKELLTWLLENDIKTVAMESTGSYWQNLYAELQASTIEVILINGKFTKNILFVGADWERKGGPILITVFEKVLKKHPDAILTIVSKTPKNLSVKNGNILGLIPVQQLSQHYKAANIFCLPTLREPFGVVFVEAMKYKLPIVANNVGGLPDLVKNGFNGYLIDNNIDKYVTAICHLLDNPAKCIEMGQNGFEFANENFTWDKVGNTLKTNIERALK